MNHIFLQIDFDCIKQLYAYQHQHEYPEKIHELIKVYKDKIRLDYTLDKIIAKLDGGQNENTRHQYYKRIDDANLDNACLLSSWSWLINIQFINVA
ncbi:MAG: hypothetical protein MZV70_51190 [Desulfobacterales bacterium]|nr:hypothetical protein [Desulfobacterales bacterium]